MYKIPVIILVLAGFLSSCKPDPERIAKRTLGEYTEVSKLVYDLCTSVNISENYKSELLVLNDWFYVNSQYLRNRNMSMSFEELLECFELSYCTPNYISIDWNAYQTHEQLTWDSAQSCKVDQTTMLNAAGFGWEYKRGSESENYLKDYQDFVFFVNEIYKGYEGEDDMGDGQPDYYYIKKEFSTYIEKYEEWVFECMRLYDDLADTVYQLWVDNNKYYSIKDDIISCLQYHIDNMYDLNLIEEYNNCLNAFNARNERKEKELEQQSDALDALLFMGLLGL